MLQDMNADHMANAGNVGRISKRNSNFETMMKGMNEKRKKEKGQDRVNYIDTTRATGVLMGEKELKEAKVMGV